MISLNCKAQCRLESLNCNKSVAGKSELSQECCWSSEVQFVKGRCKRILRFTATPASPVHETFRRLCGS